MLNFSTSWTRCVTGFLGNHPRCIIIIRGCAEIIRSRACRVFCGFDSDHFSEAAVGLPSGLTGGQFIGQQCNTRCAFVEFITRLIIPHCHTISSGISHIRPCAFELTGLRFSAGQGMRRDQLPTYRKGINQPQNNTPDNHHGIGASQPSRATLLNVNVFP